MLRLQPSALLILLLVVGLASGPVLPFSSPAPDAYVDPLLLGADGPLSVIVTAQDAAAAARLVQAAGGTVTADLWLIDAVAATLPAQQLDDLAAQRGLHSVIADRQVRAANWNGYVTDQRIEYGSYVLDGTQYNPVAYLPDGGFVSVTDKGKILIVNENGSERARVSLPGGGPFDTAPSIGSDGTIYIAGESLRVFALNPDGTTRWDYAISGSSKFRGGVALGPTGTVYAADEGRSVYALDGTTGQLLWQFKISSGSGVVIHTPVIGPDGSIYLLTDKGYIYAVEPDGGLRWELKAGVAFKLSPFLSRDSATVYAASTDGKKLLAIDAATGAVRYIFTANSKIIAQPALGPDGSLYIAAEDRTLYALNPDGSERFQFRPASGHFRTTPAVSADGATVYVALEEKLLFAVDALTGAERWRYTTLGNIKGGPVLDAQGGIILGSEGDEVIRLRPDGRVNFYKATADKITQAPSTSTNGLSTVRVGSASLLTIGPLPDAWDGRPDVQPTTNKSVWQLVNPVAIDVGADVLHNTTLPAGQRLTGAGVTVAVVDSGVFFDNDVKVQLGPAVQRLFLGQADFVDAVCPTTTSGNKTTTIGTQYEDHCWRSYNDSNDSYGHGTAVAGILWNNFTDLATGAYLGVAPGANILSVRVLDGDGAGSYATVIRGIQYVVANRAAYNVRVLNLSLSGYADVPYFVDPLNRAAEAAWAGGIVVLAAAGNVGPHAESVTVPGNDPYVITVGSVNSYRTPGYWADDVIPAWSAAGPTLDGFAKPDILAPGSNIITFMWNDPNGLTTQKLVQLHPDHSATSSLFRMNGTSMSTAVASAVVALMLQANPDLTPNQVKYRLLDSARPALTPEGDGVYNTFQQGLGRLWAPDAVLGQFDPSGYANLGMDIASDLAHGWDTEEDLAYHYQGPVQKILSDDGSTYLYYVQDSDGTYLGLGAARLDGSWIDYPTLANLGLTWASARMTWAGGLTWAGSPEAFASARMAWAGARMTWAGARMTWAGARMTWAGTDLAWASARMTWAGGLAWADGSEDAFASARMTWAGTLQSTTFVSSLNWVTD